MDWTKRIANMVSKATAAATANVMALAQHGGNIDLRLFYRPATKTEDGELFLCEPGKEPQGAVQGSTDRFHGAIPYANYQAWIRHRIGALPLLASC